MKAYLIMYNIIIFCFKKVDVKLIYSTKAFLAAHKAIYCLQ